MRTLNPPRFMVRTTEDGAICMCWIDRIPIDVAHKIEEITETELTYLHEQNRDPYTAEIIARDAIKECIEQGYLGRDSAGRWCSYE